MNSLFFENFLLIKQIWSRISNKRKRQNCLIFLLILFASIAEICSFVSFIPILIAISDTGKYVSNHYGLGVIVNLISKNFNLDTILLPATIIFIFITIFSSSIRIFNLWACAKLSSAICIDISEQVYKSIMNKSYMTLITKDKKDYLNILVSQLGNVYTFVNLVQIIFTNLIVVLFLIAALIFVDAKVSILSMLVIGFLYLFLIKASKNTLFVIGKRITKLQKKQITIFQENLDGIRDIMMNNLQDKTVDEFLKYETDLRESILKSEFIISFPRYAFEGIIISGMVLITFAVVSIRDGVSTIIPVIGSISLGSLKIMPSIQTIFSSLGAIQSRKAGLNNLFNVLDNESRSSYKYKKGNKIIFNNSILLENVSFNYEVGKKTILNKVNLEIKKGEVIGICGENGSGKSTLIEIIVGLLKPTFGNILVDGKNLYSEFDDYFIYKWRDKISYLSQMIYMPDKSIKENIAYGINKKDIDFNKFNKVSEETNIKDFVFNLPDKYETKIGDYVTKFSGGQKQRIALARALYKDSNILVIDEAANNLDVNSIENLKKIIKKRKGDNTILIISHSKSILDLCDKLYLLKDKEISTLKNN